MDQTLAFRRSIELMESRLSVHNDYKHTLVLGRLPASLTPPHLHEMLAQVEAAANPQHPGAGFSEAKRGRWLGWAQAAITAMGLATLEEFKALNKACAGDAEPQRRTDVLLGKGEWLGATRVVAGEMPALVLARAITPTLPGTPASEAELHDAIAGEVVVICFTDFHAMIGLLDLTSALARRVADAVGIDLEAEAH